MIRAPYCITEVVICTWFAPSNRNSAASRQVSMPPMPLMGSGFISGSAAISQMNRKAMGFTARPE